MAINGILRELGNGVDGLNFTGYLTIYIKIRCQRMTSRALQGVTNKMDAWAAERGLTFSRSKTVSITFRKRRKRNEKPIEVILKNQIILCKKVPSF